MSDHYTPLSLTFFKIGPALRTHEGDHLSETVRLQDPVEVALRLAIYKYTALAKSSTSDVHN